MEPTLRLPEKTPVLPIACYPWGGDYRPDAWAQCGLEGEDLLVLLWCREDNRDQPRYVHDNEPVYTDSCLEAFLACYPGKSDVYVNFEVNRSGAMLAQYGTGRQERTFLTPERFPGVPFPKAKAFAYGEGWGVQVRAPLRFLQTLYGMETLPDPQCMRGNFYKCAEIPDREHYACWAPIEAPRPDFHRPEFFRAFWKG